MEKIIKEELKTVYFVISKAKYSLLQLKKVKSLQKKPLNSFKIVENLTEILIIKKTTPT
jgi:hypothetical protein